MIWCSYLARNGHAHGISKVCEMQGRSKRVNRVNNVRGAPNQNEPPKKHWFGGPSPFLVAYMGPREFYYECGEM